MKKLDKKNTIRLIAIIVFIVVSVIATVLLIPFIKTLSSEEGRVLIKQKAESFGAFGWILFLGLQIFQIIVALIPGEPVEILGGILFGAFGGLFLCLIGILIGSIIVFYMVKAIGKPLVYAFVSEEKLERFTILQNEKKLEVLVFVLFLIPGTPKDALTYVVPLTKIRPIHFFIISAVARIPSVIGSTVVGKGIGNGNWLFALLIFIITAAIGVVGIFFNDKLIKSMKEKHRKK